MTILPIWRPGHYHLEKFLPKWHSKMFVNESKYCRKMKWYKHGLSKKPLKIPMGLAKSKIHFWKQSLKMEMDSKLLPFSIWSTVKDQLQLLCWYLTYACFSFYGVSPVGCFFMTWCLETRQWLVHASSMHLRIRVMLTVKPVFEGLPIPVWGRHIISNNKVLYIVQTWA